LLYAEEERGLVDEDSDEPAFEGAFAAAVRWILRGGVEAVFNRFFGFVRAVEDAAGDEIKQLVVARELLFEGPLKIGAGLAVRFERTATDGDADLIHAVRGSGEECWGGGWHSVPLGSVELHFVFTDGRFAYEPFASAGQMKGLG
jgi:hypothetical protein